MRAIFVGGCPRSGTTYVRNVIASHPDVTGLTAHDFGLAEPSSKTLEGWLFHRSLSDVGIITRFKQACENVSTKWVVEKTPANALVFHRISRLFPEAVLIRVYREREPTVRSIMDASSWAPLPGARQQAVDIFQTYEQARGGLPVQYEKLRNNRAAIDGLYRQIGLSPYAGKITNREGIPGSRRVAATA